MVLYGKNRFVVRGYRALSYCVPNMIGKSNMALIKKSETEIPIGVKDGFDWVVRICKWTEVMRTELPGLCELTVTSEFRTRYTRYFPSYASPHLSSEYRAMLYTAACITSRHGNLKQAVWGVESRALRQRGSKQRLLGHHTGTRRLSVRLLAEDRSLKLGDDRTQQPWVQGWEVLSKVDPLLMTFT